MVVDHINFTSATFNFTSASCISGWMINLRGIFDFKITLFWLLLLLFTAIVSDKFTPRSFLSKLGGGGTLREFDRLFKRTWWNRWCFDNLLRYWIFMKIETHHNAFFKIIVETKLFQFFKWDVSCACLFLPLTLDYLNYFVLSKLKLVLLHRFYSWFLFS